MKKEDIEFLRELQNELKTQEHDGQASPRFWGVAEIKRFPTAEDYADGAVIYDTNNCAEYSQEEFMELLEERWDEAKHEIYVKEDISEMDVEDLVRLAEDDFGWEEYELRYYIEEQLVSDQTGCFLTKKACKRHIELNGYNYNQGHTYAMTAWRNPEFEKLLKILTEMNFDDIKED